ncbi:MAG TPA: substrate-binding domain-containing protein [Opitutaceae bacterium]|nr:substrate-binding domain-containing protein [Opitutaceae bacterium]
MLHPHSNFSIGALILLLTSGLCFGAPLKIGVLLKDKTPGFWVYAEKGVNEAAQTLGVEVVVRAPPTVMDVGAQVRLLASLSHENINALVIAPTNPDNVEQSVAEFVAKGVKVVTLDTQLKEGLAQAFVGADQDAMGEAAAKIFVALLKDGDEVAVLRNNGIDRTVLEREKKAFDALKSVKVVLHADIYASSEKDTEEDQARLLLAKYPNTKAVFVSATRGTLAMIKAIREKGLVGKVQVVGFGLYLPAEASAAITDGILAGWVAQQPKDLGYKGVETAVALLQGKSVPAVVHPSFLVLTKENYRDPKIQAVLNP